MKFLVFLLISLTAAAPSTGKKGAEPMVRKEIDPCFPGPFYNKCVLEHLELSRKCSAQERYNAFRRRCEPNLIYLPLPDLAQICHPAARKPFIFDNTKYQQCNWDGKSWRTLYCQPDSIFNPRTSICESLTSPPTPRPIPSFCVNEYAPDFEDCSSFYQCQSGMWQKRKCAPGYFWSQQRAYCDSSPADCVTVKQY